MALFLFFSEIGSFGWFWMASVHKNIQLRLYSWSYTFPTVLKWPSWCVIYNIAICTDNTTFYSKCDQASDLWQQIELCSELEPDLRVTVDWGNKWLVDFNAGKTQLVSFDESNKTGSIDVKMDGSLLEEKSSFKMLDMTSSKLCLLHYLYC